MTGRAQTFTLEAFVAAVLLLASVAFAMHVVGVSSNTASAGGAETTNQHAGLAEGVLDEAAADGSLREALLYWNATGEQFHDADVDGDEENGEEDDGSGYYVSRHPPNTSFGETLNETFDDSHVRYSVDLYYYNRTATGLERERQRLVDSGTPNDEAVRVTKTVTLYDDDRLVDEAGTETSTTLEEIEGDDARAFYAPDVDADGQVYNVVRVEVVLWRA